MLNLLQNVVSPLKLKAVHLLIQRPEKADLHLIFLQEMQWNKVQVAQSILFAKFELENFKMVLKIKKLN